MSWLSITPVLCSTLFFTPYVHAFDTDQEDELLEMYGGEEGISIATGNYIPVHLAPAVASVITAKEIERSGATDITQVLERVPGLHVYPAQIGRLNPYYSIRGIHTDNNSQVLILLNGIEIPFLYTGSRDQFRMPVQAISRIEVLRGPGSAVYGADAYSGVINIITKDQKEIKQLEVGAKGGNFNDHNAWLQYGTQLGDWGVSFTYEEMRTGGDTDRKIDSDLQTQLDGPFGTSASLAPGKLDTGSKTVSFFSNINHKYANLNLWYEDIRDIESVAGAAQALDPSGHGYVKDYLIDLELSSADLWQGFELSLRGSFHQFESNNYYVLLPPGMKALVGSDGNVFPEDNQPDGWPVVAVFPDGIIGNPEAIDQKRNLELVANISALQGHDIRASIGYKNQHEKPFERKNFGPGILDEATIGTVSGTVDAPIIVDGHLTDVTGTPYTFIPNVTREIYFASLQDEWRFSSDWTLTAGVRYDDYSDFGDTTNPRLALVWQAGYNLTYKMLYGKAFRAPSFDSLYAKNNPVVLGNEHLKPERIDTTEFVVNYKPTFELSTQLNLFSYKATDLIDYVYLANGHKKAQNVRNQDGHGLEAELTWDPTYRIKVQANYAWQRSEDADTGERIADAPQQQLYANVNWVPLGDWNLFAQVNWVMDRERDRGDLRDDIQDYQTLDLSVQNLHVVKDLKMGLTVNNVFDADVREPSAFNKNKQGQILIPIPGDYPMEGRHYMLEMRYKF